MKKLLPLVSTLSLCLALFMQTLTNGNLRETIHSMERLDSLRVSSIALRDSVIKQQSATLDERTAQVDTMLRVVDDWRVIAERKQLIEQYERLMDKQVKTRADAVLPRFRLFIRPDFSHDRDSLSL